MLDDLLLDLPGVLTVEVGGGLAFQWISILETAVQGLSRDLDRARRFVVAPLPVVLHGRP
ncbi:hypothetical protein ACFWQ6_13620 [Streptomyces coelicoflavus]|uniref:hypothetical protein n=1 Tax=Streptomyces coelicoflavus TaxID=285562 RepID=UPI00365DB20F